MNFEIRLDGPPGDRAAAVEELRALLFDAGAEHVEEIRVREPDPQRRPADIVALAGLLVAIVGTTAQVVDLVRQWRSARRPGEHISVTIVIDRDAVPIIEPATAAEEKRLAEFVERHDIR